MPSKQARLQTARGTLSLTSGKARWPELADHHEVGGWPVQHRAMQCSFLRGQGEQKGHFHGSPDAPPAGLGLTRVSDAAEVAGGRASCEG